MQKEKPKMGLVLVDLKNMKAVELKSTGYWKGQARQPEGRHGSLTVLTGQFYSNMNSVSAAENYWRASCTTGALFLNGHSGSGTIVM